MNLPRNARSGTRAAASRPESRRFPSRDSENARCHDGERNPRFLERLAQEDRAVPEYVRDEFDAFLRCGVLAHGYLRVVCERCHAERLVAFSCKRRGFCPSCGARRMAESARHLVEEVFGPRPVRRWVLSYPYPLPR